MDARPFEREDRAFARQKPMHASFRARGVGSFPPSPATVDVAHCRRRLRSRRAQRTAVPRRVFRKYHMGIQCSHDNNHLKKRRIESHLASRISQSNRSIGRSMDPRFSVDISIDDGFCLIFSLSIDPSVGRSLRAFFCVHSS